MFRRVPVACQMPPENEDVLQKLGLSIVEIISDNERENSTTLGTGFVVTDYGLIVTCRHVIADSQDKLMNSVKVRFHSDSKTDAAKFTASPLEQSDDGYKDNPPIDLAFLKLYKLPEKGVRPVKLDDKVVSLKHFASIGFKKAEEFTRLGAKGEIRIPTQIKISKDILSPEVIQLHSPTNEIEPGMSGAPVLDLERDRVIGIITERYVEEYNPTASNMAFALPVKAMIELYPNLREKNPGLIPINRFLSETRLEGDKYFQYIDKLFIPPSEYGEIKKTLEQEQAVFIIGTAGYGKTYTAMRLLWEYYIKEYKAKPVSHKSDINEITSKILERDEKLKNHVFYFEDPIGKDEYDPNKEFERSIESVLHIIKELNIYLIITSRDEIFNRFNSVSAKRLSKYVRRLHLKQGHFSFEDKRDMLLGWASARSCKWLNHDDIKNQILEYIKRSERNLSTPLSIRDFAFRTSSIEDNVNRRLEDIIDSLSDSVVISFADQIRDMPKDKQLFVSLMFILEGNFSHYIKTIYEEVVTEKNLQDAFEFDRLLSYFEDELGKIRTFNLFGKKGISFSHHLFSQAEEHILLDADDYPSEINKNIYSPVLSKLIFFARDIFGQSSAISHYVYNFNSLPKHMQNLLSDLVNNNETRPIVAAAVVHYHDKVPEDLLTNLLFELKQKAPQDLLKPVTERYHTLPQKVRDLLPELVTTLADRNETVGLVAEVIIDNFNRLPPNITSVLHKVSENKNSFWGVISGLRKNLFDSALTEELLNELLVKLSRKEVLAEADRYEADEFARMVSINFDRLKEEVRNELMARLIIFPYTEERTIAIILYNYSKLSQNVRELLLQKNINLAHHIAVRFDRMPGDVKKNACDLLFRLADDRYLANHSHARGELTSAILENFDKLPSNVQDILYKLADSQYGYVDIAKSLESNFNKLPKEFREKLIMRLTNKPSTPELVSIILTNLDVLPPDLRGWVFSLIKDIDNSEDIARAISRNFEKISLDITSNLLLEVAESLQTYQKAIPTDKDNQVNREESRFTFQIISTYEIVSSIILRKYDKLQENVRALIVEFANNPHGAAGIARASNLEFDMLQEDIKNKLLLKLSEYDDSAWYVARDLHYKFDKLSADLRNSLIGQLASKPSAVYIVFEILISNFDKLPKPDAENLILYLMKKYWNDSHMKYTVRSIMPNVINKLPKDIQELVLEQAKEK